VIWNELLLPPTVADEDFRAALAWAFRIAPELVENLEYVADVAGAPVSGVGVDYTPSTEMPGKVYAAVLVSEPTLVTKLHDAGESELALDRLARRLRVPFFAADSKTEWAEVVLIRPESSGALPSPDVVVLFG
jgi:hypothetical protein